eukprot:scaffold2391_cov75-Skeletonema_dohrnii-CCMP3373.AAC.1
MLKRRKRPDEVQCRCIKPLKALIGPTKYKATPIRAFTVAEGPLSLTRLKYSIVLLASLHRRRGPDEAQSGMAAKLL